MKNGREDVENSIKIIESYIGPDDPRMKAVRSVATECGELALADRCDNSAAIYKCAKAGAEKNGMKLEDFV